MLETDQTSLQAEGMLRHIDTLRRQIGPRPPTSRNERRAAEYVHQTLAALGIDDVRDQFFTSPETSGWLAAPWLFLGAVAPLLGGRFGQLAGGAAMLAAAKGLIDALWLRQPGYIRLLAQGASQNVVARIAPTGEIKRRLFLVAHLDTGRPRRVSRLNNTVDIALAGVAGVTMLAGALTNRRRRTSAQWLASAAWGFGAAALVIDEMQESTAVANDNASGVAVLLSLAEALAAEPLAETEVILLFTGCAEAGAVGLQSYLSRFAPPRYNTTWINVAGVDTIHLCYASRQGASAMTSYRPTPQITALAARVARERPGLRVSGQDMDGVDEVAPLIEHGYEAIGVYGYSDPAQPTQWHEAPDAVAGIEAETMTRAAHYVWRLAQALDAGERE